MLSPAAARTCPISLKDMTEDRSTNALGSREGDHTVKAGVENSLLKKCCLISSGRALIIRCSVRTCKSRSPCLNSDMAAWTDVGTTGYLRSTQLWLECPQCFMQRDVYLHNKKYMTLLLFECNSNLNLRILQSIVDYFSDRSPYIHHQKFINIYFYGQVYII